MKLCLVVDLINTLSSLSDYLFVAARFAAMRDGQPEVIYKKQTTVTVADENSQSETTE
jgi:cob(I)alamin adenosyltransferase